MSGYVISNALEADGETLLDEIENDLNLDTTKFVTVEEVDQTVKGHKEFTQPLVVADPTLSTHATNKQYVENYVNSHTGGGGTNAHFQTILTKDIRINTTQQAGEGRVLFTRGENGETIEASIMMDSDGGLAINSSTQPLDLAGSKIINIKDGDDDYDAVTKRQLTNGLNGKLDLTGGSLTGDLDMGGNRIHNIFAPMGDDDATSKIYVNTVIENAETQLENKINTKLSLSGGTMTGNLDMNYHLLTNMNGLIFSKREKAFRNIAFGDKDKLTIGSYSSTPNSVDPFIHFNDLDSLKLIELMKDINCHGTIKMLDNKTITNVQNPHNPTDVANKQYVDTKLSLSGGTMTGNTNLNNKFLYNCPNPNNPQDVANKQYVDSKASNSPISIVDGRALLDASGGLWVYGRGLGEDGLITTEGDLRIVSGDAVGQTNIVIKAHNEIQLDAHVAVNMTNSTVYNLPEPTQPTEAATKQYVDNAVARIPSGSSTSQLMAYSNVRFKMNSYSWKSAKFKVPPNVISGNYVFTANLSIWNSTYTYASLPMKNHTAYVEYRLCDKNGNQIGTYVGKIYQKFGSYASYQYVPQPMNTTNSNPYYSNANVNFTYARVIAPYDEVQFQYRWREIVHEETGSEKAITPEDGFVDARVQLNILPLD